MHATSDLSLSLSLSLSLTHVSLLPVPWFFIPRISDGHGGEESAALTRDSALAALVNLMVGATEAAAGGASAGDGGSIPSAPSAAAAEADATVTATLRQRLHKAGATGALMGMLFLELGQESKGSKGVISADLKQQLGPNGGKGLMTGKGLTRAAALLSRIALHPPAAAVLRGTEAFPRLVGILVGALARLPEEGAAGVCLDGAAGENEVQVRSGEATFDL